MAFVKYTNNDFGGKFWKLSLKLDKAQGFDTRDLFSATHTLRFQYQITQTQCVGVAKEVGIISPWVRDAGYFTVTLFD